MSSGYAAGANQEQHYVSNVPPQTAGYNGNADVEANGAGVQRVPVPAHQSTISQVFDPRVGKVANPGPLGLISFGITTFVLGFYQCGVG